MADISRRSFIKATAVVGGCMMLPGGISAMAEEKPLKVRAAVFSPTGGTMNATYLLASMFSSEPEMIDQTPLASREKEITFAQDELAIFAAPSYGGRIPYAPNLFTNLKGNNTPCVIVAAYGNREAENNYAQMNRIATENGFIVIGAIAPITPHIFAARAGHSRPDINDLKPMRAFANAVLEKIKTGNFAPISVPGDPSEGTLLAIKVEKPLDTSKCIGCGVCVKSCPTGAMGADLTINEEICINCQCCSHVCAVGARSYKRDWDAGDSKYLAPKDELTYIV